MHIKPITATSREEICELAQTAADRGEALDSANVFPLDSLKSHQFAADYHERLLALEAVA